MDKHGCILVFAEQETGAVHQVTYELLGKGRELANKLNAELDSVLLGYEMEEKAEELISYGADKVFLYDHLSLQKFDVITYKQNIVNLVEELKPEIFLIGATRIGRTLAPRVAASLKIGLTADCVDLGVDNDGNLVQIRPAFSGNVMAQIKTRTKPQMATVRYKVMKMNEKNLDRKGVVIRKEAEIVKDTGMRLLEKIKADQVNVAEAEIIVSGGKGLRKPEDFGLLEELARVLSGVVGSSRPLVDAGWIGKEHQIGFSGNTVKPRVYIACGISGAPQHLFGMRDSDIIIAINEDPSAPILDVSDYCVIGDLYEILPALIKELKKEFREEDK